MSDESLVYVFQLPARVVCELSSSLDPGNCWEEIAFVMPGLQDIDIEACRRLSLTGDHPTESLLRIWGSKGYTILDLYKLFFKAKLLRCMQILLPYVDNKYHQYAQVCERHEMNFQRHQLLLPNSQSSMSSPVLRKASYSVQNKVSAQVYSRKGEASNEMAAGSSSSVVITPAADPNGSLISGLQNTLSVKYEDLAAATGGFQSENVIGRGGYGVVYRGVWKHTEVAIKRIQGKREGGGDERQQRERIRQSLQELRTLAKFRHDNILSLYGYSLDGPEPCLIYQFMAKGSLEDRLLCRNGSVPLSWQKKLSICKGVGCGLHFLHTIGTMPIIHGDVKSANILLDKHFEPKLGDFGLSRDGQVDGDEKMPMIASHVKGTLAYLPPEFLTSRILTTKLDVYSYGVVLLEVATGQRAFTTSRDPQGIVEYALKTIGDKKGAESSAANLMNLADKRTPQIETAPNQRVFERLLNVGVACTQKDRFSRPMFSDIFAQLNEVAAGEEQ